MTVREALAEATLYISRRDAELLLAHVLGRPRTWVLSYPEHILVEAARGPFDVLVRRRDAGEPLQYLLGAQEFFGLRLRVTPDVLIPRPETEHLVEAVLAFFAAQPALPPPRLADVGTGSGAIALALAARMPTAEITALDLSPAALEVARGNAESLGLAERVRFLHSDLLGGLAPGVVLDAVVSNPPYVPLGDADTLQREVVAHEPHLALFAGEDGLEVYRRLIPAAQNVLRPGGLLALEIGFGQRAAVEGLLAAGWRDVRVMPDYAGIDRVVTAIRE